MTCSFSYRGAIAWNDISNETREISSLVDKLQKSPQNDGTI
jgi:hypothetical protein